MFSKERVLNWLGEWIEGGWTTDEEQRLIQELYADFKNRIYA